jgi:hypothetical protein
VGYQDYQAIHDGDAVTVSTSRLFKQCASIARDGVALHARPHWRLWSLLAGAVLIGMGMGWLRSSDGYADD